MEEPLVDRLRERKAYYSLRKRRGLVSKIIIDDVHSITIDCDLCDHFNRWYVYDECAYIDGDIWPQTYETLSKAKIAAFELSNTKCTHCYDEHGNRRRDN
jgi:hypothetical protein